MKKSLLLVTVLNALACSMSFGQTKYIKTGDGEIIDTLTYTKLKDAQIEKMKKVFSSKDISVTIKDNFREVRKTSDSIIYSYKWDMKIGDPKVKVIKSFDSEDYIDKEFPLPNLMTLDGKEIELADLKGKPTLINFWFTTCKPCIEEMPVLNKIKAQLKDSVNFIAITFESTEKVKLFYKRRKFNFTQIVNSKKFIDSMNMETFSVNLFLDKNGIVRKIENGIPYIINENKQMKMGDGKEFVAVLRELL